MNPNEQYWHYFYSNTNELPSEPSNFALYTLNFLQKRSEKNTYKNILDIGCGNGRDSYFFSSQGYKVSSIDPSSTIKTDKFQFSKKSFFDYDLDGFDVYYLRFVIHTLVESECDQLFERLANLPPESYIAMETRSTTNISPAEKSEKNFKSPIGEEHFRMLYSKSYMDRKISKYFDIVESLEGADFAKYKSENPFCLRYIIRPKKQNRYD